MLVQFSTKIKAVKCLRTQTPWRRQSHALARGTRECWANPFGALSTCMKSLNEKHWTIMCCIPGTQ